MENLIASLNTISGFCTVGDSHRAQELIRQIVELMRYRYGSRNRIVPLEFEVRAATALFDIYSARFPRDFDRQLMCSDDAAGTFVPHYTLMAFAENCVLHAFDGREPVWRVEVTIESAARDGSEATEISVVVRDNGRGFDADAVLASDSDPAAGAEDDYTTVAATVDRLRGYYGDGYHLSIDSTESVGTTISLRLPKG